jgi:acyl carrier protein
MTIETQIKEYITKNLLFSSDGFNYPEDASFIEEGIVDSQGVMDLVFFVEESFKVQVKDTEIVPDNFDSVSKVAAYIRRKQANG